MSLHSRAVAMALVQFVSLWPGPQNKTRKPLFVKKSNTKVLLLILLVVIILFSA